MDPPKPIQAMKAPSENSFKPNPKASPRQRDDSSTDGNLFLGQKVLGELRILMRLASPTDAADLEPAKSLKGRSY